MASFEGFERGRASRQEHDPLDSGAPGFPQNPGHVLVAAKQEEPADTRERRRQGFRSIQVASGGIDAGRKLATA